MEEKKWCACENEKARIRFLSCGCQTNLLTLLEKEKKK